jgi:hypothetical protein
MRITRMEDLRPDIPAVLRQRFERYEKSRRVVLTPRVRFGNHSRLWSIDFHLETDGNGWKTFSIGVNRLRSADLFEWAEQSVQHFKGAAVEIIGEDLLRKAGNRHCRSFEGRYDA